MLSFKYKPFSWQTNELVMSLDDDENLILQDNQTLRAAGVGKSLTLFIFFEHFLQGTPDPKLNFHICILLCHV